MELLQPYGKYILIGLVAIAGIALVVWISIVAIVMRNTRGIPSAINNFLGLVSENNLKEAYNSTTDNFQNRISQPQFKKLIKNYKFKQYQRTSLAIPQMSKTGNDATIDVTLVLKSGREIPLKFALARQNKEWKIDFMEVS